MFCVVMLFFACDDSDYDLQRFEYSSTRVETYYFIKNTSNQPISFDVDLIQDERMIVATGHIHVWDISNVPTYGFVAVASNKNVSRLSGVLNPNDSTVMSSYVRWEDLKNPPQWFTKLDIYPVEGIQMNDPYSPENWIKITDSYPVYHSGTGNRTSVPAYTFILNIEN